MKRLLLTFITILMFSSSVVLSQDTIKEYDTEHYRKRIELFRQNPIKEKSSIIFIGDSMIEGGKWSEYFSNSNVINRGIVGDNTEGMSNRFDEIVHAKPAILFLSGGVNDISQNVKTKDIVANFRYMIRRIKEQSPNTVVYLQSAFPINNSFGRYKRLIGKEQKVVELNKALKKLASQEKITFIDNYPIYLDADGKTLKAESTNDGLHLKPEAYLLWAEALRKYIKD